MASAAAGVTLRSPRRIPGGVHDGSIAALRPEPARSTAPPGKALRRTGIAAADITGRARQRSAGTGQNASASWRGYRSPAGGVPDDRAGRCRGDLPPGTPVGVGQLVAVAVAGRVRLAFVQPDRHLGEPFPSLDGLVREDVPHVAGAHEVAAAANRIAACCKSRKASAVWLRARPRACQAEASSQGSAAACA